MTKIFIESVILSSGHALIMSHKPDGINMNQVNTKLSEHPQDVMQFGLFDRATPNYTTYYPDVSEEDLQPKDSEFIEPIFRMLSNVTVHANFNPIHFPADVLKKSMYKLVGQTVNIDHEMALGNAIGTIKSVEWQNAYTANGVKVPAGINAVLKIDGKSNPRIARGIMMDPPSIHANSVTVNFAWAKSHPKMDDNEFFSKLGTFDDKGKLIQKIATEIKAYHETSLVSHGADPFAQKIDSKGKIVLPNYAAERYPLSENNISYYNWDWKHIESDEFGEVCMNKALFTGTTILENNNNNNDQNSENMELLKFLETFFGLEADSLTDDNVQAVLGEIDYKALMAKATKADEPVTVLDLTGLEAIEAEITELRNFKQSVPEDLENQLALAATGLSFMENLRKDTKRLYSLSAGAGKEDPQILVLIENADNKTLESLHKQYDESTEKQFGFVCQDCNSHNVTRASAKPGSEEDENSKAPKSRQELIDRFTGVNEVTLPSWLKAPVVK